MAKKTKKTGAGGKSVKAVRDAINKNLEGKAQSVVNVPVKPSTQKGLTKKKRHGLTEQESKSIDDRYLKLVKIQSLFKLKEHVSKNRQKWGGGSTVTALPPSRPFSVVPTKLSESYLSMYNYFKEIGNWSEDDLISIQDYSMQGGGRTQTAFLLEHGFLKEVNPRWIDINPNKIKPHVAKGFVAKEPDGIKIISEYQGKNLPEIDVTYRKETGKTQIGLNKDGSTKFRRWTKYYRLEYDHEITPEGQKFIQEDFKNLANTKGTGDIETFLPSEKESSPALLEDITYEVLPEPVDPNMPPEGTLSRQEAITESKKRREERQKSRRGYVDKPLVAPKIPSLTGKAAGRSALPGGGFPSKKLPPKFRMGGFIPYST